MTPQPQHAVPPNTVCDFEHGCFPEKNGSVVPPAVAPPVAAVKPVVPQSPATNSVPDDPLVTTWRECMAEALQDYEQSHDLHALQMTTPTCTQVGLEAQGDADVAGIESSVPLAATNQTGGRRNIGCGWWPIGSDADRDCAAARHR